MISLPLSAAIAAAVSALDDDPSDLARRDALDDLGVRASSGDAEALTNVLGMLTDLVAERQADLRARTIEQLAMNALCASGTGRADEGLPPLGSVARAWPSLVPRTA
jgi:hypothetical protein